MTRTMTGTALAALLVASCATTGDHSMDLSDNQNSLQTLHTERIPDKTVVLTFDDAVRNHLTYVAPLLRELGFGATFSVSQAWLQDTERFLTWEEIGDLHRMGFEIANHTWTHGSFNTPESAETLREELEKVNAELKRVGVPGPVSFVWPGNAFGPESLAVLREMGFKYARRGMQPEYPYGEINPGPLFDPLVHDPLLIPTSGDAYPEWTLEHFRKVVDRAEEGKAVILQFYGVPDEAHPWVDTPPERFREYMQYLKDNGFQAIALRGLERYINPDHDPRDPMREVRHPEP